MDWLIGTLPTALVLVMCPLMMIFIMRGMHASHGWQSERRESSPDERVAELERELRELRKERDQSREKAV